MGRAKEAIDENVVAAAEQLRTVAATVDRATGTLVARLGKLGDALEATTDELAKARAAHAEELARLKSAHQATVTRLREHALELERRLAGVKERLTSPVTTRLSKAELYGEDEV